MSLKPKTPWLATVLLTEAIKSTLGFWVLGSDSVAGFADVHS
jgi:hypothetical protein